MLTLDILTVTIPRWKHLERHGPALLTLVFDLQCEFAAEFEAARVTRNKKNTLRARSKRSAAAHEESDGKPEKEEEDEEMSAEEEEQMPAALLVPRPAPRPIHKRRALEDTTNALCAKDKHWKAPRM
ncbi:hypothetical protein B0H10DRAFT_1940645 [Mycena sp. CBHHK59/15]|nr:hypothetical protein B0H10DRAFT_1940645 [Mycena sp. CBHHK59/15]